MISWLTDSHGRVDTSARGALKPGGPFSGLLDLFRECEITFVRSRSSEVCNLREATLIRAHDSLGRSTSAMGLAAYFCELVRGTTETGHAVPEIHALLSTALAYLDDHNPERRVLHRFESRLAGLLGVGSDTELPERALARLCHRLPPGRTELWRALPG
jgi:recombinational DNA repair protein (RecF pathway)